MQPGTILPYRLINHRIILVGGGGLLLLTALFSAGYHHPDEHFQLLEFANYKLGNSPLSDLPWEFSARIRPALQATIAMGVLKSLSALGIGNPFVQATVLRLLTALLSFLLLLRFTKISAQSLPGQNSATTLLAFCLLLWFMPFLQVRFSSESWSAIAFMSGVLLLLQPQETTRKAGGRYLLAGLLLGLSFFFRFQMGFALLGVPAWLFFQKKRGLLWMALIAGGILSGVLGVLLDAWFYGEWVLTPWLYFKANIVDNVAANWGVSPWYFYVTEFITSGAPPVSLLLLGLFGYGFYRQRSHLMAWVMAPYLLAHFLVGHKEMRFLFPMVLPFLYFVAAGWQLLGTPEGPKKTAAPLIAHPIARIILRIGMVVNILLLLYKTLTPAQEAVPYLQYIYNACREKPVRVYAEKSAYSKVVGLKMNFYTHKNAIAAPIDSLPHAFYVARPGDLMLAYKIRRPDLEARKIKHVYCLFPDWLLHLNFNHWQERSRIWAIYRF